jgi:hypothetical protein
MLPRDDCRDRFLNLLVTRLEGFASKTRFSSKRAALIMSRACRGVFLAALRTGSECAVKREFGLIKSSFRGRSPSLLKARKFCGILTRDALTNRLPMQTSNTAKWEEELATHVRKAITADESAPKQKHVRACIVYTWDLQSSGSFWVVLKNQPVLGDEVMTFKALITFHKVIKDGHPQVLRDGITEAGWLETLVRGISHMGNRGAYPSVI